MVDAARLYLHYLAVSVRGQMQYRASFAMATLGTFAVAVIDFLAIWALFDRFGSLRGWSLAEGAVFFGMINIAFALAEGAGRGFDAFPGVIRRGDFDRLLLRPRAAAFQVAAGELHLVRVGRLLQGVLILAWGAGALDIAWTAGHTALAAFAVLGGACLFTGLFVIQATLAFWTVDALEVLNTLTDGGREAGSYPLNIYRDWFRRFFTFFVPLACVSYYPGLALLGRLGPGDGWRFVAACAAPVLGVVFLAASLWLWCFGVRHYTSTGS